MNRVRGGLTTHPATTQDVVYRWLKRHIDSVPRSDGKLLTEVGVATATGTSRTPVREAFLRLEAEGFLRIIPKKGAFVPPVEDAEIVAVMEAHALVEEWSSRTLAARSAEVGAELDQLVGELEGLVEDPVKFIDTDREFHGSIVRMAGNPVLADFYESLRDRQVRMGLRAVAAEGRSRRVVAEHREIVDALRLGDADAAGQAVAEHLHNTMATLDLTQYRALASVDQRDQLRGMER